MLGRLLFNGGDESRAISYQQLWMNDQWDNGSTWSGTPVTQTTALQIDTVYACVRLYVDTISSLPVAPYIRQGGEKRPWGPRPLWMDEPGAWGLNFSEYLQQFLVSLLIDGNTFVKVLRRRNGEVIGLQVLDPTRVEVDVDGSAQVVYRWDGNSEIPREDMLHVTELRLPGQVRGVSRITQLKQSYGLARGLEEFAARFFGQGSVSSGIIEMPQTLNTEQSLEVARAYENQHKGVRKSHKIGVLGGGAKWVKTGVDPDEAQMLESRQAAKEAVAMTFRVPLFKLQSSAPGSQSYNANEANDLAWYKDSLRPYIDKIERAHTKLLPPGVFMQFNMDAVLRADTATRYAAHNSMLASGWGSINDVRRYEGYPAIDGGDALRVPLTNVDLAASAVVEQEKNVAMAVDLINAGADPEETLAAFGLPPIEFSEPRPVKPTPVKVVKDDEPADDSAEDDTEETP